MPVVFAMYLAQANSTRNAIRGNYRLPRSRSLRRLGGGAQVTTSAVSTGAGAAASYGTGAALTAAGVGSGALLGTVVPVVGSIIGALIGGLLSGHFARAAGAKNENAALNQVVPAIIADIKSVFTAANAGQISTSDAQTALQAIQANYWQSVAQYQTGPGQHAIACQGTSTPCNKQCTASCCVGCDYINDWIARAAAVFASGGGTAQFKSIAGSKYGFSAVSGWSATYTPPAGGVSLLASSGLSSSVVGLPLWVWLAGGALLFFVMR